MKKFFAQCYIWILLIVLYAPIVFISVFSFTESKVLGNWTGFSTKLYTSLFSGGVHHSLLSAIENTIIIAIVAAALSTLLGSVAAIGIHNMYGRKKMIINSLNNIPMLNPDIITGISLFLLFVSFGISQGFTTVVLAHIAFCTPYVVLSVMPRLRKMNPNIYEAALDLGATPWQALIQVIVPQIMPGIVSGALIAFTMSFDDFIISYFVTGGGVKNLSIMVYTMSKCVNPSINAISTVVVVIITVNMTITMSKTATFGSPLPSPWFRHGISAPVFLR